MHASRSSVLHSNSMHVSTTSELHCTSTTALLDSREAFQLHVRSSDSVRRAIPAALVMLRACKDPVHTHRSIRCTHMLEGFSENNCNDSAKADFCMHTCQDPCSLTSCSVSWCTVCCTPGELCASALWRSEAPASAWVGKLHQFGGETASAWVGKLHQQGWANCISTGGQTASAWVGKLQGKQCPFSSPNICRQSEETRGKRGDERKSKEDQGEWSRRMPVAIGAMPMLPCKIVSSVLVPIISSKQGFKQQNSIHR